MKLLIAHNFYRHPGGEDEVFHSESELLRRAGHEVVRYVRDNDGISENGIFSRLKMGGRTLWNRDSACELRSVLRKEKPELVHFHNIFPLISPAAYYACQEQGIPVVQSLHNPRLLCPAATLYREARACEDCVARRVAWPSVVHACYHNSRPQTAIVAAMLAVHRFLGTWGEQVDAYIVFTEFFREKFIAAGLPPDKIFVKPHFLSADPGTSQTPGSYVLFVGRLAPEKGVRSLLRAWRKLSHIPLQIVGSGPLESEVQDFKKDHAFVRTLPHVSRATCFDLIKGARFLVWPSEGYNETFGLVAIEAFACGKPVIASRIGAMPELVQNAKTGLHFEAGNADDLAAKVEWAWSHPEKMGAMGEAARAEYQAKYTAQRNYQLLMEIYQSLRPATTWKAA